MKTAKQQQKKRRAESVLRKYIQKEIRNIMDAEEVDNQDVEKVEEPQEEEGLSKDMQAALDIFLQRVRRNTSSVEVDDLVEIVSQVIDAFVSSNETKLNILRSVKSNIVR